MINIINLNSLLYVHLYYVCMYVYVLSYHKQKKEPKYKYFVKLKSNNKYKRTLINMTLLFAEKTWKQTVAI